MSFYSTIQNYFSNLAYLNIQVAHNRTATDADGNTITRRSFIAINEAAEFTSAVANQLNTPCIVQINFQYGIKEKDFAKYRDATHELWFLSKAANPTAGNAPEQNQLAYDEAEDILNQFISRMNKDFDDGEATDCGIFKEIDFNNFTISKIGAVADNLYGWSLRFITTNTAKDLNDYDEDNWQTN